MAHQQDRELDELNQGELGGDYARDTHRGGFGDDYARDGVRSGAGRGDEDLAEPDRGTRNIGKASE